MHRSCVVEVFQVKMDPADLGTFLKKAKDPPFIPEGLAKWPEIFLLSRGTTSSCSSAKNTVFDQQLVSSLMSSAY